MLWVVEFFFLCFFFFFFKAALVNVGMCKW